MDLLITQTVGQRQNLSLFNVIPQLVNAFHANTEFHQM
ncbi:hypothetical protein PSE_3813 [Pseudovibrio sp. FO-BEG1]|nr:hypothetical protein PSE_3813 [Pseudovibrio sp. FO-BEG1]